MSGRELLIVAGEVSGDIHAGNLLRELNDLDPTITAYGVGGDRLIDAGLEAVATVDELAHMGLVEVLRELPRILRLMNSLVDEAKRRKPDLAVLVDSPDFNLRLARRLRSLGIPVVLYVSPQLWAWRRGRVHQVRELAEEVLCILPFEVPFYEEHGVKARYVGHPLVDEIYRVGLLGAENRARVRRLGLLPGSRGMEVRQLLPVMMEALALMPTEQVEEAVLIEAPGMESVVDEVLAGCPADSRLIRSGGEDRREALVGSALAWTASGTATLECTLLDVPMVVGYKLRALSFALARLLVKVPNVALVNLIAGETVVPELLQKDWNGPHLAEVSRRLLADDAASQRPGLARARRLLGEPGASRKTAMAVRDYLRE